VSAMKNTDSSLWRQPQKQTGKDSCSPEQSFAWARLLHVKKGNRSLLCPTGGANFRTGNLAAGISPKLNLSHREFLIFAHYLGHFSCITILTIITVINQSLFAHGPCF
jgi:hypothetical protein